ncbi:MAG: cytochrome c/FTR1 family iron permease [Phenylobacterium sp.]|uniref:cytochrome c/FTR1 family iron permease n=1 Tax=Phenylobacterium sp. TaxID=1871053 RepID=UPI001A249E2B|nr:cytochrome c/FTR1 family iron permease [Phenylobacterium sp.]MBJ7411248.1 cytochrome c/FTR1 family iron permease [Phenylobacterium sp.]
MGPELGLARLRRTLRGYLLLAAVLLFGGGLPAVAQAAPTPAETVWRLLDYVAVDYSGAVQGGKVVSAAEYAEMQEFSATATRRIRALPGAAAHPELAVEAVELERAIAAKADVDAVAAQARRLASDLLAAYPVPLAPQSAPDLARGAALYQEQCAACHGATGAGDGPNARGMDPPPIAFVDRARADHRSLFGLYQVIDQGLDGTAMPSFAHLPAEDRWSLAFYVGRFAYNDAAAERGARRWREDPTVRAAFPDLAALTRATPASLAQALGPDAAVEITAYLRRSPEALLAPRLATLTVARAQLAAALKAYAAGDRSAAEDLALSTYLDGVEPVEPAIAAKDRDLLVQIETAMAELRNRIGRGAPVAEVQAQASAVTLLFDRAEAQLGDARGDKVSAFVGAFTVLLREGLEALLIVVAMIAFLRKAERQDVLPYVHGGWVAALAAGVATWAAATYLVTISGASRELTEGFGALLAAAVLVSVGVWMHGKSQADAWQRYIRDKLSRALSRRSAWFLFLLSFVVVYREVFETILFYTALWNSGATDAIVGGAAAAVGVLTVVAWVMLRYSGRLPIGTFFAISAGLVAVLAVVLVGKGVAALQEAGLIGVTAVPGAPRIEILGLYATLQTLGAQLVVLAILAAGFLYNRRAAAQTAKAA